MVPVAIAVADDYPRNLLPDITIMSFPELESRLRQWDATHALATRF